MDEFREAQLGDSKRPIELEDDFDEEMVTGRVEQHMPNGRTIHYSEEERDDPSTTASGNFEEHENQRSMSARNNRPRAAITPNSTATFDRLTEYEISSEGILIVPGTDVELCGQIFLRVYEILSDLLTHKVWLKGLVFLRNGRPWDSEAKELLSWNDEETSMFLCPAANEVHLSANVLDGHGWQQSLRLFPIEDFIRVRFINITNQDFPALNPSYENGRNCQAEEPDDVLVCRWAAVKIWKNEKSRAAGTTTHCWKQIRKVSEKESDPGCSIEGATLMYTFRRIMTTKGGSSFGFHPAEVERRCYEQGLRARANFLRAQTPEQQVISFAANAHEVLILNDDDDDSFHDGPIGKDTFWKLTEEAASPRIRVREQRYTFGDIFSGAGGASAAAVDAGLEVKYAVDCEPAMCATYQLNNPATRIACTDARTFAFGYVYDKHVDILHLSFPCQPYSRAHTTVGKDDKRNREALAVLDKYLDVAKPRIVTIEEADGLAIITKHAEDLRRIILQLTMKGYTVEFKVINFADYGISQSRNRLIIIASCPGQRHPGFPAPTHANPKEPNPRGLRRWVSEAEAISGIPPLWKHHNVEDERLLMAAVERPLSSMCQTLITKNARVAHHEGWRCLTVMEKLLIQGFKLSFEFPDDQSTTTMEKQIGNAVPPKAFAVILRHIKQELLRDDDILVTKTN